MQFKLHLHDDTFDQLKREGKDLKDHLRNSISRHLTKRLGFAPWYYFVLEDLTKKGLPTRTHAHGSIQIVRTELPQKGEGSIQLPRVAQQHGLHVAELLAGRAKIVKALKAAGGDWQPRFAISSGVDQARNLWSRRPTQPLFNAEWVDYAFKNTKSTRSNLGENRLAMTQGLRGEARRLWQLVTRGESAISLWEDG